MTDKVFAALLSAIGIAAFERGSDGTFTPLVPPPKWFGHLSRDMTFPFLGAFLEEAGEFWAKTGTGRLSSGLCAEVDERGQEFHFEVSAVAAATRQFLVFERAHDADALRAMLQKAREQALDTKALTRRHHELQAATAVLDEAAGEARGSAGALIDLAKRLGETELDAKQRAILVDLRGTGERLLSRADTLVDVSRAVTTVLNRA
jgi:signal transduction histidine kinase